MGLTERLFGRTKRTAAEGLILIYEKNVKPQFERYVSELDGPDQLIADGAARVLESLILQQIVIQTLDPPKPIKKVYAPQKLGDMKVIPQ